MTSESLVTPESNGTIGTTLSLEWKKEKSETIWGCQSSEQEL